MPERHPLFVAGVGRSGTTVLTELLSSHPLVGIGMERYKSRHVAGQPLRLDMDDFERSRFFAFDPVDTNITPDADPRWRTYYDALADKYDDLRYVGDKVIHTRVARIWEALPEARVVCIVRNLHDVAASWQARADNPDDVWFADRDARASVDRWNDSLLRVARAQRARPDQVAVVEYERLFGDPGGTSLRAVVGWLGLDWTAEIDAAFTHAQATYASRLAGRPSRLTPEQRAYVDEHANLDRWRRVLRHAI